MHIPVDRVPPLVAEFLDKELIPKGNQTQKFFTALVGAAISRQIPSIIEHYRPFLEMIHILHEDKMDFDVAKDILTETFAKVPTFTLLGINFNQADVDIMHQMAKRYQI